MIPDWLKTHLENNGQWNADGISRRARPTTCKTCHTQILTGLDADIAAGTAHVDPVPLTSLGELAAHLTELATYHLRTSGQRIVLDRRDQFSIAGNPADTNTRGDILPEHQCGRAWTGPLTQPTHFNTTPAAAIGATPPY